METMTIKQWNTIHRDFKTIMNDERYVLRCDSRGTHFVHVVIVK